MVRDDIRMSQIVTRAAFENAILVHAAIGGSTNAVIHLHGARRAAWACAQPEGLRPSRRETPMLVNLMPSGKYLMEGTSATPAGCRRCLSWCSETNLRRDAVNVAAVTRRDRRRRGRTSTAR
jgi:dihydroxy-acid dehydratase